MAATAQNLAAPAPPAPASAPIGNGAEATDESVQEALRARKFWHGQLVDDDIPPETREIFEKYSKIPPDQVAAHVSGLRDEAFALFPYPCIGQYRFLLLTLCFHPRYAQVLQIVKDGGYFVDVGACFGQDLRKLIADGAPPDRTYSLDIDPRLMELGYTLFRDRATLTTPLLTGSVIEEDADWSALEGKMDVVHASALLHLFTYEDQVKAGSVLARFSRGVGTLIVGRQMGRLVAGDGPSLAGGKAYRHDVASFQKMWDVIGDKVGMKWKVDGSLDEVGLGGVGGGGNREQDRRASGERRMLFTIERVA